MNESITYQTVHQLKVYNSRVSKFAIEVQVQLKKYTFYVKKYAQFYSSFGLKLRNIITPSSVQQLT